MGLDLSQVVSQIMGMAHRLKEGQREGKERLGLALSTFRSQSGREDALREKVKAGKTTWLVAGLAEGLGETQPPPPPPSEFTVLAVDGSHIAVDRHSPVRCYLINLGLAGLHYGEKPQARLFSQPHLYCEESHLGIPDPAGLRPQPIEGVLLGIVRGLEEGRFLAGMIEGESSPGPILALMDGSLILWGLAGQAYPQFVKEALLARGWIPCLEEIRKAGRGRELALASYISFSGSTEVVNALRVALCPHPLPDCDHYCRGREGECRGVAGVEDRVLFGELLGVGERSPLFCSQSSVVRDYYGDHQIYFFYLKLQQEVARIELPSWAAQDRKLVNLVQGLVFDQARRGGGYPVALAEAHEQAVVTTTDREGFWRLVAGALEEKGLSSQSSPKSQSKRFRWV